MTAVQRALGRVKRRLRVLRAFRAGIAGLVSGAGAGLLLLLVSFFTPVPGKWELAIKMSLVIAFLFFCAGFLWPVSDRRAAEAADGCGLKERAQTALLLDGREDAMAVLQRKDAIEALSGLDSGKIKFRADPRLALASGIMLAAMGICALLPDPQGKKVMRMEKFNSWKEAAQQLSLNEERQLDNLADETALAELKKILDELRRSMDAARDEKTAYLSMQEAETKLERLRSGRKTERILEALSQNGLSELADAISRKDQKAINEAAEAMMRQGAQSAEELKNAAFALGEEAGQPLQAAADAISQADLEKLQNSLSQLSDEQLLAAMDKMQELLKQMRNAAGMPSQGGGQAGSPGRGMGEGKEGNTGGGRGSTHEDQGYSEDSGRQRGQGSEAPEYRENTFESIYDPTRLNADQTNIQESGERSRGASVQLESAAGAGTLDGQVPYRQVVQEYREAASQAMGQANLPPQEQGWVNDYFSAITE